jgi:hypothetical protein
MGLINFILNLAGLLLWLNWRATKVDPLGARKPATLLGTLRRAEPKRLRRWHLLATIAGLIFLRAIFYWQIGSAARWAGQLNLGVIILSFRTGARYFLSLPVVSLGFLKTRREIAADSTSGANTNRRD